MSEAEFSYTKQPTHGAQHDPGGRDPVPVFTRAVGYWRRRVFTSSGTWTKPSGLIKVLVEGVGGGGGGGGVGTAGNTAAAGGGGGGYCSKEIEAEDLGDTESVTVGQGGAGGSATGGDGSSGGNTSFGSHFTAGGGQGGRGRNATAPSLGTVLGSLGLGGSATGGDLNIPGGSGGPGIALSSGNVVGGEGGASFLSGRVHGLNSANGVAGLAYGGGGSGASSANTTGRTGGQGAAGVVIVWENLSIEAANLQ